MGGEISLADEGTRRSSDELRILCAVQFDWIGIESVPIYVCQI